MKNMSDINKILLSVVAGVLFQVPSLLGLEVGVKAEWDKPKTIVMHTPGKEVFHGVLHADAALYEGPFDRHAAKKEHKDYISLLRDKGIDVVCLVDILLEGTINEDGTKKEGKKLDELIEFTSKLITYDMPSYWALDMIKEQEEYKNETLRKLHPKDLVWIILENPKIDLRNSLEKNTKFVAESYQVSPLMNMHFSRDQQITTDKGIVIGKMNSVQRNNEVNIMEFAFNKLGAKPIYRVTGTGRLEGGDFIPVGEFALLGQGLRTNAEGVRQLLKNDVFGFPEVVIVKDPFQHQDQMHLDTYFNIIGPKKALVDKIRRERGLITRDDITRPIRPVVDIYKRSSDGKYECVQKDKDFFEYLEQEKGFEIIDIEDSEQLNYGCNFLCIGDCEIVGVKGVGESYAQRLVQFGVNARFIDFGNVTKSYGGPHCTTQVISRISK